jgi:hypothetical protein
MAKIKFGPRKALNMRRAGMIVLFAIAVAVLCATALTSPVLDPIPFTEGNYWIYRGVVRYQKQPDSDEAAEAKVTWKMEIGRVLHRDDGTIAALVKGFPSDLNWSTGDATPGKSALVRTTDGRFFLLDANGAASLDQKFKDPSASLRDLLTEDGLWFQWPLVQGKKFCDEDAAKRDDGMYCWTVEAPAPFTIGSIKGVATKSATAYPLAFRTNPDDTEVEIVPGIGIVRYEYHHHGTVADTELSLVEFHSGS